MIAGLPPRGYAAGSPTPLSPAILTLMGVRHEWDENGELTAIIDGPTDENWLRKVRLARQLAEDAGEDATELTPEQMERGIRAWDRGERTRRPPSDE
jgi:hypothetical protein